MGKNNKARRAAKAKARQRRGTPRSRGEGRQHESGWSDDFAPDPSFQVAAAWFELERSVRADREDAERLAEHLATMDEGLVDGLGEETLVDMCGALFDGGWQPRELAREIRRGCSATAARLVEIAICVAHAGRSGPVDERWAEQIRDLSQVQVSTRPGWLAAWRVREALTGAEGYRMAATVMARASSLPKLDLLIPPPGHRSRGETFGVPTSFGVTADPMLDRIRKLLAKAEATQFEEEASAYTAKAQALMTRHAIDHALLENPDAADVPRMMRLPVDAPYADAKASLLGSIAVANRCRAVFLEQLGMCSVLGHAGDLAAVELLFTSLLVQAQHALRELGRSDNWGRRGRQASFRASFLVAYSGRIAERLTHANAEVLEESPASSAALPVLRSREDSVEEFLQERYGGTLVDGRVRGGWDLAGSAAGRRAADAAKLDSGELLW